MTRKFRSFILATLSLVSLSHAHASTTERRGTWISYIDSDFFDSPLTVRQRLEQVKDLGFNLTAPVALNGGMALFDSPTARRLGRSPTYREQWQGRDLLRETIVESERLGLAIFPWIETIFYVRYEMAFVNSHRSWFTLTSNGKDYIELDHIKYAPLNPLHPEVQKFITQMLSELVHDYKLAGLQIDDHFAMDINLGYDPWTITTYGRVPPRAPGSAAWDHWTNWRSTRFTAFLQQLSAELHRVGGANFRFELSPSSYDRYHESFIQDWENWTRAGYLDALIVQTYTKDNEVLWQTTQDRVMQEMQHYVPVHFGLLAGLGQIMVMPS
ncbi:MAG: family 10 glycosylhydrolase, partial [Bdellovibrionales bacterium]|nr:family 10 glycosylhydrolase [Bdellovibrionales bacterium]